MRFAVALISLVALSAPALAESRAGREFEAGIDAFRLGKLDAARTHLDKAVELDAKLPGPHRFLAAVAQAQNRFDDCIAETRIAIELNPRSAELADTKKLHDACREAAGKALYRDELGDGAAISVTTSVPGATVTIDRLGYGGTPLAPRPIKPGPHAIEVAKAGYRSASATVTALPGIVTDIAFELVEDPTVAAKIDPVAAPTSLAFAAGDAVVLDGSQVAVRAGEPIPIAPGEHLVEVRLAGKQPWRRRVLVAAGQRRVLVPTFEPARAATRRRGWIQVGIGSGVALVGGTCGLVAAGSEGTTRTGFLVGVGVSALGAAALWTFGIVNIVRGRELRDAPPPFAIAPIEGGALATSQFVW